MVTTTTVTANSSLNNIGSALSSAELSVRELETENLVPLGEIGELCISGPHVARGYLDRPETTKTAFFHDKAGRLVYRTGDLSRQLADGQFELYGRKDNQVKINGYRIELGEIETAIQNTNMVDGCVVLGKKAYGKLQLVACYKPFSIPRGISDNSMSPFLDPSVLKHIRSLPSKLISLAHYMMPTIWLPLAQFPLLPSGKIDRKSLSKLVEMIDPSLMAVFQATMSSNSILSQHTDAGNIEEVVLQQAWGLVFEKEPRQISTSSAFYTLGGDSIAAINLVSACRRQGYEITVADILAQPTIQLQAKRLRPLEYHQNSPVLIDSLRQFEDQAYAALKTAGIESNSIEAIYPCLPGQAEFLTQGRTEHQFWQLMTVRKVPPNFDLQRWTKLVTDLTARNQILRATFLNVQSPEGQKWVQAIFKDPVLDLDTIFYRTEKEKWHIIDALWESSFTVHKPAVQYRILKSSLDGSLDIYIKVDHGTYDGTLLRIFDEQFVAMAKGLQPPMVTEFHQLIHLYATSPAQKIQNFWISLLADASFAWPINVANPKVSKMTIRKTDLVINSAARDIGVTVPIIFQTAWGLLLGALSNSHDVVYDNLLTGRNVPLDNPQAINGNCANFLPFRSRFPPAARLHTLLHDTQALLWDTTDNGLIGLADIYHALGVQRSERAAKTMFCFQPFDPPPKGDEGDMDRHMRWVVMAMSTNRMFFNYAFMCEVFKAVDGYSIKFQYDSRALSDEEAKRAGDLYLQILEYLYTCGQEDTVDGLWKAVGVSMA